VILYTSIWKNPRNYLIYIIIVLIIIVFTDLTQNTNSTGKTPRIIMLDDESAIQKLKMDTFFLKEVTLIDNDILSVIVSYSGGCKKHDFILAAAIPHFTTTDLSQQANLVLAHENNDDACKKIVKEHLYFDLLPLKERYQQVYGIKASSIVLRLMNASINYQFK
jgi:hypothetical protein